jgi:TonB family protein
MNALIRILIENTIILSGFYFIYQAFFANDKDFKFTRIYLISSSFLALLIPQLNIPILSTGLSAGITPLRIHHAVQLPEIIISDSNHETVASGLHFTPANIILMIYLVGLTFFMVKFLFEIFRLITFIQRNSDNIEERSFYKMIPTGGRIPTSSFFNYLFWDESVNLTDDEKNQIIQHEEGHISQFHSLDIIYLELLRIIFWFNPFIHGYRKAIATIHEYLADEYVIKKSQGHPYLNLLARQVLVSCNLSINNHFSKSRTIKRIRMIKSNHHKPAIVRWGVTLSIITLMFYFFACDLDESYRKINTAVNQFPPIDNTSIITPEQIKSVTYRKTVEEWIKNNPEKPYVIISSSIPGETMNRIYAIGDWEIPSHHVDEYQDQTLLYAVVCHTPGYTFLKADLGNELTGSEKHGNIEDEVFNIVDTQPVPQGGMETFYKYVMENLKYPEKAKYEGKEGKVFVEFIVRKNGAIDQVKVIKGFDESCDEEALRIIRQSPDWIPGYQNENAVDVRLILPITFKLG